jgi:hypothetical protein
MLLCKLVTYPKSLHLVIYPAFGVRARPMTEVKRISAVAGDRHRQYDIALAPMLIIEALDTQCSTMHLLLLRERTMQNLQKKSSCWLTYVLQPRQARSLRPRLTITRRAFFQLLQG